MTPSAFRVLVAAALSLAAVAHTAPAHAATSTARTDHVALQLIVPTSSVQPGTTTYVGLRQTIVPGWHTYWRNPGDAGLPTKATWSLPTGWKAGDFVWAAPTRTLVAGLMSYVYSGDVLLPVPLSVPKTATAGSKVPIRVKIDMVVCSDVCIPESATLGLTLQVGSSQPVMGQVSAHEIETAIERAPKPVGAQALFEESKDSLDLFISGPAAARANGAYFYPYDSQAIAQAAPQRAEPRAGGLLLRLKPGGGQSKMVAGVVVFPDGKSIEVDARHGVIPAAAREQAPPMLLAPDSALMQVLGAALLAFVGGLILNLMPCVFPIISMKATALATHSSDPKAARSEAVMFLAGVFSTFLLLAIIIIAARRLGESLGWGFQLQSPSVVLALALILLAAALNLSGVFEAGTSMQGIGSSLATKPNRAGTFFTGALAVVVAAPCTAPLMAPAIGWAATQTAPVELAIFAALAAGFGLPFALLCLVPAFLQRLPKPGPWMAKFKASLAFPLYASAGWLAWVLACEEGTGALPGLFAAAVALALALWCWGLVQKGQGNRGARIAAIAATLVAIPAAISASGTAVSRPLPQAGHELPVDAAEAGTWSPSRVAQLRREGRPALVDFTAAWCITCQVNRKLVLDTPGMRAALKRTNAVLLSADWTSGDPEITRELAKFGRSGVPLYLVYDRTGNARVLPQILTLGAVENALDQASRT